MRIALRIDLQCQATRLDRVVDIGVAPRSAGELARRLAAHDLGRIDQVEEFLALAAFLHLADAVRNPLFCEPFDLVFPEAVDLNPMKVNRSERLARRWACRSPRLAKTDPANGNHHHQALLHSSDPPSSEGLSCPRGTAHRRSQRVIDSGGQRKLPPAAGTHGPENKRCGEETEFPVRQGHAPPPMVGLRPDAVASLASTKSIGGCAGRRPSNGSFLCPRQ